MMMKHYDPDADNDGGGEGGNDDGDIEIAPLIPPATATRGTFFQRSTSNNSIASSINSGAAGNNMNTPPPSFGGLPSVNRSSSSSLERSSLEQVNFLIFQAIGALCFGLMGWYIPRFLIQRAAADIIERSQTDNNPNLYQTTTVAGDVILNSLLSQPYVEPPTIPSRLLLLSCIWIPLALILISATVCSSNNNTAAWTITITTTTKSKRPQHVIWLLYNVQAAFGGFCTSIGLSEGMTQMLKLYIQRKRPNYFALCDFDKIDRICKAEPTSRILEANFSFPSGHSSLAACAMTFLALHVISKIISLPLSSSSSTLSRNVVSFGNNNMLMSIISQQRRKQLSCLLVVIFTASWALFVGASRIVDSWHHPSDVVTGWILGCFCALVSYHVWFPPIWLIIMTNGTSSSWTTVAGIPWSLIAAATAAAAAANGGNTAGTKGITTTASAMTSFHE